jgi:TolB protein
MHPDHVPAILRLAGLLLLAGVVAGCDEVKIEKRAAPAPSGGEESASTAEIHLQGIQRLTSGGINREASLSPDGNQIAWLQRSLDAENDRIMLMDLAGCAPRPVGREDFVYQSVEFPPDGHGLLYARARRSTEANWSLQDRPDAAAPNVFLAGMDLFLDRLDGPEPIPLTARPGYDGEGSYSRDGHSILYTAVDGERASLRILPESGGASRELLSWLGYAGGARLSPLGDAIVFQAARTDDKAGIALYICRADGSDLRLLDSQGRYCFAPSWHPGGQFLIYAADTADGDYELFRIRPEGGERVRLTFNPGLDADPVFSHDGRQLVWTSQRQGTEPGCTDLFRATWIP